MPPQLRYSSATIDVQTDAVCALLNGGYLRLYEGSQPTDADVPADGTLLVELRFSDPAFGPSNDGVALANDIPTVTASTTGTAQWLRTLDSSGQAVFDGDVATSGAVLNLDHTLIQEGANVIIADFSYSSPKT